MISQKRIFRDKAVSRQISCRFRKSFAVGRISRDTRLSLPVVNSPLDMRLGVVIAHLSFDARLISSGSFFFFFPTDR